MARAQRIAALPLAWRIYLRGVLSRRLARNSSNRNAFWIPNHLFYFRQTINTSVLTSPYPRPQARTEQPTTFRGTMHIRHPSTSSELAACRRELQRDITNLAEMKEAYNHDAIKHMLESQDDIHTRSMPSRCTHFDHIDTPLW